MKYIFEFILITIIISFVWNTLKRLFFSSFYKNSQNFNNKQTPEKKMEQKVNWDAETIDYEEIKDDDKSKN